MSESKQTPPSNALVPPHSFLVHRAKFVEIPERNHFFVMNTQNSEKKKRSHNPSDKPKSSQVISSKSVSGPSKPKLPLLRSVPAPSRAPYRHPISSRENEMKSPMSRDVSAPSGESSKPQTDENSSKPTKTLRPPFRSVPLSTKECQKSTATGKTLKEDKSATQSTSKSILSPSPSPPVQSQKEGNLKRPILPVLRSMPPPPRYKTRMTLPVGDVSRNNLNSTRKPQIQKKNGNESHQRYSSSGFKNELKSPAKKNETASSHGLSPKRPGTQDGYKNLTDPKVNAVLAEMRAARKKKQPNGAKNSVQLCQDKMLPLPKNDPLTKSTRKRVQVRKSKTTKVMPATKSPARKYPPRKETTRRTLVSTPTSHSKTPGSRKLGKKASKTPPRSGPKPQKRASLSSGESDFESSGRPIRNNKAIQNRKSYLSNPLQNEAAKNKEKSSFNVDPCRLSSDEDRIDGISRNERSSYSDSGESFTDSEKKSRPSNVHKPVASKELIYKIERSIPSSHLEKAGKTIAVSGDRGASKKNYENNDTSAKKKPEVKTPTLKSFAGKLLPSKTIPSTTKTRKIVASKSLPSARAGRSGSNASSSSDAYETASSSDDDRNQKTSDDVPRKFVAGKSLPSARAGRSGSNASSSSDEYETASSSDHDHDQSRSKAGSMSPESPMKNRIVKTAVGKNLESQEESDCRTASQKAKLPKDLDNIRAKNPFYGGTDYLRKSSALVMDEGYNKMKQYANRRRLIRTKCSMELSDQNRTGYVTSVRQEFFLEMEYHLYLQRQFEDDGNGNIRTTLLNAMGSFTNIIPLRIEGLQSLGAELEHKNYASWEKIFRVKKIALEKRMDQTWKENFKCIVDSLEEEGLDALGKELTLILNFDQFMFFKENWILLKEVLDLIDRSASELFSIQDQGAGCHLQ